MNILTPILDKNLKIALSLKERFDLAGLGEENFDGFLFIQERPQKHLPPYININNCFFQNCDFSHTQGYRNSFTNIRFETCDFSNIDWSESRLERVEFINCKFTGSNLSQSILKHILFENCKSDYCNFGGAQMQNVKFQSCDLEYANFGSCKFKNLHFEECNLDKAEFLHTSLRDIDFRTNSIQGLRLAGPELQGCKVTSIQAVTLAGLLGLVVEDSTH